MPDAYPRLDVLVNNVGGFWAHRHVTADGLEHTFALNHLGPILLTHLLLDVQPARHPAGTGSSAVHCSANIWATARHRLPGPGTGRADRQHRQGIADDGVTTTVAPSGCQPLAHFPPGVMEPGLHRPLRNVVQGGDLSAAEPHHVPQRQRLGQFRPQLLQGLE